MVWFRVCDTFHSHAKAHSAGREALGLWTLAGSWSSQQLTDGFVPHHVVTMYGTKRLAARLVSAGLWETVDGGFQFHDWKANNELREQVKERREKWRAKKAAQSSPGEAPGDSGKESGGDSSEIPGTGMEEGSFRSKDGDSDDHDCDGGWLDQTADVLVRCPTCKPIRAVS